MTLPTPATSYTPHLSEPHPVGIGVRHRYRFDNGYGASVVQFAIDMPPGVDMPPAGSYGIEQGLWELAVLHDDEIDYDSPITDDVIGHLTDAQVNETLAAIAALPARP